MKKVAQKQKSEGKRVLLAEDESGMSSVLGLKLKEAGFESDIVQDGEEALEKLKANKYDYVLLDLMMPKVDGFEVMQKMKQMGSAAKIFVLSNLSQTEDIQKAKQLGATDFFVKSNISIAEILSRLQS